MKRRTSGWVLAMTVLMVSACGGGTDSSDTVETTVATTPTTAGAAAEETTTVAETTMAPETTEAPESTGSDPYGPSEGESTTSSSSSTSTTPDDDDDDGAAAGGSLVVSEGDMGSFLTTADGFSVYLFLPDEQGESTCYDDCEASWPPMTGDISAGEGVDDSLLGTTTREDGSEQVTYNGWPLYFFANDAAPGDTNGQGVSDVWYLVTPDGEQVP